MAKKGVAWFVCASGWGVREKGGMEEEKMSGKKGNKNLEWVDSVSASSRRGGDKRKMKVEPNFFEGENSKGRIERSNIKYFPLRFPLFFYRNVS